MTNFPKTIRFKSALLVDRWLDNVCVEISADGVITRIQQDENGSQIDEGFDLVALPGMVNCHSHAFQRGFAGLSEFRTAEQDSFWTWRKLMYEYVDRLNPDDVFVIARQLYLEMLAAGYTWVGEFHYIHNAIGGDLYSNASEMSDAILRAATESGIGICHLPVLYQRGGFDGQPLSQGQDRFKLTAAQFVALVKDCQSKMAIQSNATVGIAIHSIRAVENSVSNQVIAELKSSLGRTPIHIHVAEQTKEIEDCLTAHNKRSVEFLFSECDVNEDWCLIHATHLDDNEVQLIADSGAVVGLCPTTESNLGDGFFRAAEFLKQDGRIAIGSDSHCSVDLRDELRTLEYGQRLQTRGRAVLGTDDLSVGRRLYCSAARGGGQAMGVPTGEIKVGNRADFTLVDSNHPAIAGAEKDRLLDRAIFTNVGNPIVGTVVGGNVMISAAEKRRGLFKQSTQDFIEVSQRLSRQ